MDPAERFIEAATDPLAETNAELHLAAQQELRERIDASDEATLNSATDRLKGSKRTFWIPILLIVMGLVSLPILWQTGLQYRAFQVVSNFLNFSYSTSEKPPAFTKNLTNDERLLLHGDLTRSGSGERWKALWDSRPDYPPYFANYVGNYLSEHDALPPGLLENAARIDPDNGWYWAIAAAYETKGNVTKTRQSIADRDAGKAPTWTTVDPAKSRDALDLLEIAISKPRFTSYSQILLAQQIPLLPKRSDYLSQFPSYAWVASLVNFSFKLRPTAELLAAEAERCGKEGNLEGFRRAQKIHHLMANREVEDSLFLVEALIAKVFTSSSVRNFRDAADSLGLASEADAYRQIDEVLNPDKKEKGRRADLASDLEILSQRKGSVLGSMTLPMVGRQSMEPVEFREDEITPARMAEYALLGRVASLVIWAVIGVSLLLVFWIRPNPQVKPLALQMRQLFLPADWAWIIGGGILGPIIWHLLIAQFSPLAAHYWSMQMSAFMVPVSQYLATALMMIITPLVIVRWRMKVRMPFLRFNPLRAWFGWLAVASPMLAIPFVGVLPRMAGFSESLMYGIIVLLGYPAIWLLSVGFKTLFLNGDRALASRTIASSLIPAYTVGMILLIIAAPVFHAVEKNWVKHDHLMEISAEEFSLSRYESRVTQQLKSELLETLSDVP